MTLCDAAGVHDASVAEWVAAVLLADAKRLPEFDDSQRDRGEWHHVELADVEGMHVLVLGHGSIGAAVEKRLAPFGVTLHCASRAGRRDGVHAIDELPDLLGEADAVVVLVPLTDDTRGLLDADALARMKPGALLINAARGPVVDTDALVAALHERPRSAPRSTSPTPSRCRRATRCGRRRGSSSRRTSPATSRASRAGRWSSSPTRSAATWPASRCATSSATATDDLC